jgi:putative peptidoglycan lipid II flippase
MNSKSVVFILVVLGSLFALIREAVIAYHFGITQESDVFRIAYTIPNYFVQTLGTILVSSMVGYTTKYQGNNNLILQSKITLAFWLYVLAFLGFLSTKYQVKYFYPGYFEQVDALGAPMLLGWVMFAIVSVTFFRRAELNILEIRWPSASVQLIRAGGWVAVFLLIRAFGVDDLYAALYAAIITSIFLLLTHFILAGPGFLSNHSQKVAKIDGKHCLKFSYLFAGVLLYQILASSPRFIDRYYASLLREGSLSSIEFSYGLVMALSGLLLTSLTIIFLPRVVSFYYSTSRKIEKKSQTIILLSILVVLPFAIPKDWSSDMLALIFMRGNFGYDAFVNTSHYFDWHIKGLGFLLVGGLMSHFLIAINQQALLLIIVTIKFCVKLSLMIFFFDIMKEEAIVRSFLYSEVVYFLLVSLCLYLLFTKKKSIKGS